MPAIRGVLGAACLAVMLLSPLPAAAKTVRIATALGYVHIALLDDVTPLTVANFLGYVHDGDYDGTFLHRSIPGFILQGGGWGFANGRAFHIPADPPVANEFARSNLRGTVAMAKLPGDPDSATSEWFVNLADNSANLDAQNGGFTVFGEVVCDGMDVVDALAGLRVLNAGATFPSLPAYGASGSPFDAATQLVFLDSVRDLSTCKAPLRQAAELKALGGLCKAALACHGGFVKAPGRDPGELRREACLSKAEAKFASAWLKAGAKAPPPAEGCPAPVAASDFVAQEIEPRFEALLDSGPLEGWTGADPGDNALRAALLKSVAGYCTSRFAAEGANALRCSERSRVAARAAVRTTLAAGFGKALAAAAKKGVADPGVAPADVAGAIDAFVEDLVAAALDTAP